MGGCVIFLNYILANIAELILFIHLDSLSKKNNIKVCSLILTTHHSFPVHYKHRRAQEKITKILKLEEQEEEEEAQNIKCTNKRKHCLAFPLCSRFFLENYLLVVSGNIPTDFDGINAI